MFSGIEEEIFNDPEFKEDSVREVIIAPILSGLGYMPNGSTRVTRSKTLRHPFIRVGTKNHPVLTIPDYTIFINDRAYFVLDAKAPNESVLRPDHIQQAYSYAIHPEVGCREFGLCNGREFVIFSTNQTEPLLHLKFNQYESHWDKFEKHLLPRYLTRPVLREFKPDFGTALKRMGFEQTIGIVIVGARLNIFGRVSHDLITASANCDVGFGEHCVSFDFSPEILDDIVAGLPKPLGRQFIDALNRAPFQVAAGLIIEADITAELGEETQGRDDKFIPLIIKSVHESRFNPIDIPEDPNEYPPSVFVLKDAFEIRTVKIDS